MNEVTTYPVEVRARDIESCGAFSCQIVRTCPGCRGRHALVKIEPEGHRVDVLICQDCTATFKFSATLTPLRAGETKPKADG